MKTFLLCALGAALAAAAGSGYAQTGTATGTASGRTVTYTFPLGKLAAPTAPANLRIVGQTGSDLVLAWDASMAGQDRTIAGYELLRNGVAVAQPSGLSATVKLEATGTLLEFFSVRARDSGGAWSAPGNEVLAPRLSSDLPLATAMRIETKRVGAYRSERGWRAIDGSNELRYQRADYVVKESETYVEPNGIAHSYSSTMTARMEYGENSPDRSITVSGACDFRNYPIGGDYGTNGYSGFTGIVPWTLESEPSYDEVFATLPVSRVPGRISLEDLYVVSHNAESSTHALRVVENEDTPSYRKTKSYELTLSVPYGAAEILSGAARDYALALDRLGQLAWGESVMISYGVEADESLYEVMAERAYDDTETEVSEQLLQAGIYRIETETPGRQRLRWAEVFYPYYDETPVVLAVREEIVDPEATGPYSGEYTVEAPATPGYVVIVPVGLGIEVRPPAAPRGNDGARLFVRDGLFVGQAAEIVLSLPYATEEGSGEIFTLHASATGESDPVRLLAIDQAVEESQGLAAALAQGQPITPTTNLLEDPYPGIAEWGGWKLMAVGMKAGTAVVAFDVEGEAAARSSVVLTVYPMPALAVDANRDGRIALPHEDASDATSADRPFRFWINDDDDSGDISQTGPSLIGNPDEPGRRSGFWEFDGRTPDFDRTGVDGRSDLLDFFPVFLGLKEMTASLSPSDADIKYKLFQGDFALNFIYTDLEREAFADYLKHGRERSAYGVPGAETLAHEASTAAITASGTTLDTAFLARIRDDAGKGIVLMEGRAATDKPLRLVVEKGGLRIAEVTLSLKISGVEDMYRWINLRAAGGQSVRRQTDLREPENNPDGATNGKMFIFVHGYNVNERQSRAWNAEAFKRLHQSGSRAMFAAVSWNGDHSQLPFVGVAPDYWDNITRAFKTAQALAPVVGALPGSSKVIAGHSMGNVVVSSAIKDFGLNVTRFLMLNAAVPLEAYDTSPAALAVDAMRHPDWSAYTDRRLWPTAWHSLFPVGDGRRGLTWMNRFGNIPNAVNIYSSGEEVLNNNDLRPGEIPPVGPERVWIIQEMAKGTMHLAALLTFDIQGGWGFNDRWWIEDAGRYRKREPAEAAALTEAELQAVPFFRPFRNRNFTSPAAGSAAAADPVARADALGGAIPALSFPAGRNPVPLFDVTSRNLDLMDMQDGWPQSRLDDQAEIVPNVLPYKGRWFHSDIKNIAYVFNRGAWETVSKEGALK